MERLFRILGVSAVGVAAWWWLRNNTPIGLSLTEALSQAVTGGNANAQTQTPSDAPAGSPGSIQEAPPPQTQGAVSGGWSIPDAGAPYEKDFATAELLNVLPLHLLARMAQAESGFDSTAVSSAGAKGLMQFTDATARDYGIDPLDPRASIAAAGRYMRKLYDRFSNWRYALAAYNWGPQNLDDYGYQNAPQETLNYAESIARDLGL